ncbi:MAG: hypothetical protein ISS82_00445 [Nanoarchaeota archaeon]|nr:hypothetical protein [Nanoarchaeota archaeon]
MLRLNKILNKNERIDSFFLLIFITIFLWMSLGPIMNYRLVNDFPTGFGSCDAYAWFTYSQNIYESGNFKYDPPFLHLNYEGFVSPEPPLFLHLNAYLSHALGIPLYDAQVLLGVLLIIFAILIFFVTIKSYNPILAYFSIPLTVFSFTFPFIAGLVFGILPAIFGFLFLFATLFILLNMDIKYSSIILGIFFSAMIMGHPIRVFEFLFFGGFLFLLLLIFKKMNWQFFKKIILSIFLAFITSLYYLSVLKERFINESGNFAFKPVLVGRYMNISLNDFGIIQYVIILGLILCFYFLIKDRKNLKVLIFTYPLVAFILVQFFRFHRMYQIAFFWPLFFSLAFGSVLYMIFQFKLLSKINKKKLACLIIAIILSSIFIYQYYYFFREPVLEKIYESGTTSLNQKQWDNLVWISKNTKLNAKILFFYSADRNLGGYFFFPARRLGYYIQLNELDSAIEQRVLKKDYNIKSYASPFFYKRNSKFPLKVTSLDKETFDKELLICDFDYIYGKIAIPVTTIGNRDIIDKRTESRVLYTVDLFNTLLKNKNFEIVHKNEEALILKNNDPGGKCL